jgi:hypothetical protein
MAGLVKTWLIKAAKKVRARDKPNLIKSRTILLFTFVPLQG